jgi:hypothetical protein
MAQIFVSYARVDNTRREQIMNLLKRVFENHKFWYDKNMSVGDVVSEEIIKEINKSRVFLILGSKASMESDYCRNEYRHAMKKRKKILPIFIENPNDCKELAPVDIRHHIETTNYIELSDAPTDEDLARLYGSLVKLLAVSPPLRYILANVALLVIVLAILGFGWLTLRCDPKISIESADAQMLTGKIEPDFLCSDLFRAVVYVKTDIWYIQPNVQGVVVNSDTCEWETRTGANWNQVTDIAIHLVPKAERYPSTIPANVTCPPLNASEAQALVWTCLTP